MDEFSISEQIESSKTDSEKLNQALTEYDLDEALTSEFDALSVQFQQLEIKYQSILNTRRYLLNGTH